jgi:eukaryotic-like serine/threonine-protein kinase
MGVPGPRSTTPAVSRPPQPGDLIADRYDLEELVGTGGMSSVFRAHDRQLERDVAIKILHAHYASDPEYLERFRREARAVARLSHPNIVTVIDRGDDDGRQYIVFEHVEGENLKELVLRSGRLSVRRALELALAIADGLSFAHDHGLVHRDVKPQNILLSREGEVKVTDFGIARSLHMEHGMTQTGTVLGTGEYLAPEQASGKPVSPATDVYSLGIVLWELLAGDVPFTGDNFVAVALRHVNEPPPHLRERRPDVTPRLDAAIQRALAKDPARRFPSMTAFAKELRACLAEAEGEIPAVDPELTLITPPPTAPARAQAQRRPRPRRPARTRRRPLVWALLALLVAGVAFAAVLLLGGGGNKNGTSGGSSSGSTVNLTGVGDAYVNPGHPDAHANTAGFATDGSASSAWMTQTYLDQAFGGLLPGGLGLVLDAGSPVKLGHLTVKTPTPGFTAEVQSGDSATGPFAADSSSLTVNGTTTFSLYGKTAQYYVVWITQLPPVLYAKISEVTATS